MTYIAAISQGLSEGQKLALIALQPGVAYDMRAMQCTTRMRLMQRDLIVAVRRPDERIEITPRGEQVRAHLLQRAG